MYTIAETAIAMTDKELAAKEAKRDLGAELLESVKQMKAGRAARVTHVEVSPAAPARNLSGLSQSQFATLMGVSVRTLQEWEQGRREPTGAAQTLLRVVTMHPEVLRELQKT